MRKSMKVLFKQGPALEQSIGNCFKRVLVIVSKENTSTLGCVIMISHLTHPKLKYYPQTSFYYISLISVNQIMMTFYQ